MGMGVGLILIAVGAILTWGVRDTSDAIGIPGPVRAALHDALARLLDRARAAGAVRPGITAADLVAMLKGLLIAGHDEPDPHRAARLLAVFTDGLRPPGT